MESNSTHLEENNEQRLPHIKRKNKYDTEVHGSSFLYMFIFYLVTALVVFSMIFQFISLKDLWDNIPVGRIEHEMIDTINKAIPYENLIISLILYCLGMFGFEGTRAVIMSFDLKNISDKAKNMPAYKRNRLIQILISFTIITIMAMILEMICIKNGIPKADFQLSTLTTGIGIFMSLLAYSDLGPKLSKQVSTALSSLKPKADTQEEPNKKEEEVVEEK